MVATKCYLTTTTTIMALFQLCWGQLHEIYFSFLVYPHGIWFFKIDVWVVIKFYTGCHLPNATLVLYPGLGLVVKVGNVTKCYLILVEILCHTQVCIFQWKTGFSHCTVIGSLV